MRALHYKQCRRYQRSLRFKHDIGLSRADTDTGKDEPLGWYSGRIGNSGGFGPSRLRLITHS